MKVAIAQDPEQVWDKFCQPSTQTCAPRDPVLRMGRYECCQSGHLHHRGLRSVQWGEEHSQQHPPQLRNRFRTFKYSHGHSSVLWHKSNDLPSCQKKFFYILWGIWKLWSLPCTMKKWPEPGGHSFSRLMSTYPAY